MTLTNGVYVLPIPRGPQEADSYLNLTLIVDEDNGTTLVDAGLPDQTEAIGAALVNAGIGVRNLRRMSFTHQDLDHVGWGQPSYVKAAHGCWHILRMPPTYEVDYDRSNLHQRCSNNGHKCARSWSTLNPLP